VWWCECRYTPSTRGPWCPRRMAAVCRRVAECNQSAAGCRVKPRSRPIMATASTEPEGSCQEAVPTSIYPESIIRVSRRRRDIPFLDPAWNQVRNEFTYRPYVGLSRLTGGKFRQPVFMHFPLPYLLSRTKFWRILL